MSTSNVRLGLVGAGRMGRFHAETVARRLRNVDLVAVADTTVGVADEVTSRLGGRPLLDPFDLIADSEIDAVLVAAPATCHSALVQACAEARKPVWVEKPMALTMEDASQTVAAARTAGVALQVGFNRRFDSAFASAHGIIDRGELGRVQLLRSLTRDPGLESPDRVPPWTIFRETLIHDFDLVLWLACGAKPIEVFAMADALVAPEYKSTGLLDTSVVQIRLEGGAMATVEACFSTSYGYDVRCEVLGSQGMVTAGDPVESTLKHFASAGCRQPTSPSDTDLFRDAYTAELAHFVDCVISGDTPAVTGEDARDALALAWASMMSVEEGRPVFMSELGV